MNKLLSANITKLKILNEENDAEEMFAQIETLGLIQDLKTSFTNEMNNILNLPKHLEEAEPMDFIGHSIPVHSSVIVDYFLHNDPILIDFK